jgi:hypothetical protein
MLALAGPARAQHVICCMLLIDVKGNWIGASRDCAGGLAKAPPDVLKKACEQLAGCEAAADACPVPCDQAKIDGLRGRMKGLAAAAEAHRKGGDDAERKRHDARDKLWGKGEGLKFEGGSIADFGKAGLDSVLLATGGGGGVGKAYSEAMKQYKNVSEWTERGWALGSDPTDLDAWTGLGKDLLEMQADDIFRRRSTEALRSAREHFQKTGNYVGAQNVYRQKWGNYGKLKDFKGAADKFGKFTGALDKLAKLYEKTDKLANDLQSWTDAFRDQKIGRDAEAKAQAEMDKVQKQLDRLLAACGNKPAPAAPQSLGAPSAGAPQFLEGPSAAAALPAPGGLTVAEPGALGKATFQAAQAALREVRALQRSLGALDRDLGRQIVAPLSPWFAGLGREGPPQLLLALVKGSRASFTGFEATLGKLSSAAERAWRAAQDIPPDEGR